MANWQKRSRRFTSRAGTASLGSKSLISPPKRTLNSEQSKRSRGLTPLFPAQSLSQNSEVSKPNAVTTEMPVTTTRLVMALLLFLNVLDGIADRLDLLVVLVGDGDLERVLELHHQFHDVQRIGLEVVDERLVGRDFFL